MPLVSPPTLISRRACLDGLSECLLPRLRDVFLIWLSSSVPHTPGFDCPGFCGCLGPYFLPSGSLTLVQLTTPGNCCCILCVPGHCAQDCPSLKRCQLYLVGLVISWLLCEVGVGQLLGTKVGITGQYKGLTGHRQLEEKYIGSSERILIGWRLLRLPSSLPLLPHSFTQCVF